MKLERQRLVIAEAHGWEWKCGEQSSPCWHKGKHWSGAALFAAERKKEDCLEYLPDYPRDMNALREAIRDTLTHRQKQVWANLMDSFADHVPVDYNGVDGGGYIGFIETPAATLADMLLSPIEIWVESFLRVLGLWGEDEEENTD